MKVLFVLTIKPLFLRGQSIYLCMSLQNQGLEPVRVPQPNISANACYSVTAHGAGTPRHLNRFRDIRDPQWPWTPESEIEMLVLQPGQEWTGLIHLEDLFPLKDTGSYRVSATLACPGGILASNAQDFKIEETRVLQISLASDGVGYSSSRIVYLRDKGDSRGLMYDVWGSGHHEEAIPERQALTEIRSLAPLAVDPVACSTAKWGDLFDFVFWREGNSVLASAGSHPILRKLTLPGSDPRLIEPALVDPGHSAHLYALTKKDGATSLVVARFVDYLKVPGSPERILAERPLPAAPLAAATFIDLLEDRPRRFLALARMDGTAPRIDWLSYLGDEVPETLRSHAWKAAAEPIADSRPAILGVKDGARVAWVVREAGKPTRGLLLEASFDAAGALKTESATVLEVDSPILAARIVYVDGVPFIIVWTEDGKASAYSEGRFRTVVEKCSGKMPPLLCVVITTPYVIEYDAVKGMIFVAAMDGR